MQQVGNPVSTYRFQLEREPVNADVRLLFEGLYHYNVDQTGRNDGQWLAFSCAARQTGSWLAYTAGLGEDE